jgi:hypothetical protein
VRRRSPIPRRSFASNCEFRNTAKHLKGIPTTIRRAHEVHPITALQTEYFLLGTPRRSEDIAYPTRTRHRFHSYSTLGRGFLTGTVKDTSDLGIYDVRTSRFPRFVGRAFDKNKVLIELKGTAWPNSCYQSHNLYAFGDDVVVYMQKWQQVHQSEAPRRLMFLVTHVTPKKR